MSNENENESLEKLSADLGRHANSIDVTPRPGFKEALRLRLREAVAVPVRMSRFQFIAYLSPVLAVLVIAMLVIQPFYGVKTAFAQDQFTLVPESSDSAGVALDSAFLLTSRDPVVAADIEKLLVAKTSESQTTPNPSLTKEGRREIKVSQVDDRTLRIAFDEPLAPEEIVKISLPTTTTWPDGQTATRDYNWAFQAKGDFQVTGMIPGDETSGVPLDAGIEFTFNYENVSEDEFQRAFVIEPAVAGHVESSRRTFVFVPEKLEPLTAYAVTLKGSLPLVGSSETLGEDVRLTFETSAVEERGASFHLNDPFENVTPTQAVALSFGYYTQNDGPETVTPHVKLYRYASFEDYVAALSKTHAIAWRATITADNFIDTSAVPAQEFDAPVVNVDGQDFLVFPESIPEGEYVADVSALGMRSYAFIGSSNLTSYVSRATNKTMFWVNDAGSGKPVAGASVGFVGQTDRGTTDAEGLGSVLTASEQGEFVQVRLGSQGVALPFEGNATIRHTDNVSQGNWTYLYADRSTYKPTDTMHFWGYVERRDDKARPTSIRADVGFAELDVEVTENGTFSGTIDLRNVDPSYYLLKILWGGEFVTSRTINVSEYVKPAYTLSIETDIRAAFIDETVGYSVHGAFFEGTPVNGLEVRVTGDCGLDQVLTLDVAGNAHGSFSCAYDAAQRYPISPWMSVRPNRPEEGQIEAGTNFLLFGPKVYVDTSYDNTNVKDGVGTIEATIRNVQAIDSGDPKTFGPTTRAGQAVDGTVTEITYVRRETGQSYDFVRKQVVIQYYYDRVETQIATFRVVSDEFGVVRHSFPAANKEANYRVDISATDENGRTDRTTAWVWARTDLERYDSSNALTFNNDDVSADQDQWNFPGYKVGERVNVSVYQHSKPFVAPAGSNFLYYQAQRGIRETELSAKPSYTFAFEQKHVPNVAVHGVFFDHGVYQQVGQLGWWYGSSGYAVAYDNSQSKLAIALTPDGSSHRPGEEVSIGVRVTDKNGAPVSAAVNLNVVDEAYYALYPETVNPLGDLYRWVDDGVLATAVTKDATTAMMGAEKGGGGGRGLGRSIFKDTADFQVIETNAAGEGMMTLTLPDNITQWRVTAQAIDANGKRAGDAKLGVNATQPFFLSPVMKETYLVGDEPTLIVRAAGMMVGLSDTVEYEITVPDGSYEKKLTAPASDTVRFDLPELPLGIHNVTIAAKTGKLEDKITRTVDIVPSYLLKPVISSTTDVSSVDGADDRYTELTFLDAGMGKYYPELQNLAGWWGDRTDEAVVRLEATKLLNDAFGEENELPEFAASQVQGRGVMLLPYADDDFDLSARVALLGKDSAFNEGNLARYFYDRMDDEQNQLTPRETAMAFAALSALGEPVLAQFQRAVPNLGDDPDVRLWIALGLRAAGDDEAARTIYRDLVTNQAKSQDGYIYLPSTDLETTVERTSLLAILAGGLNEPQRDQIHDYVMAMPTNDTTIPLERFLYLKETLPHLIGEPVEFAYTLRGEKKTVAIASGNEILKIKASPEERSRLAIAVTKGKLQIVSRYDSPLVDLNAPVDRTIGVKRTYSSSSTSAGSPDPAPSTSFKEGDLVKISLAYELPTSNCPVYDDAKRSESIVPCETYEITDVVPSGLSVLTSNSWLSQDYQLVEGACVDYPWQIDGQRVSYFANPDTNTSCGKRTFVYYARVVTPGTYVAEPAYIRSTRTPDMNNHSDASSITITP